jgi:hypothetical protein
VAPKWSFRVMQRGELNVDPIQSEFFSVDAIGGLAEALVRECIQNSLDAGEPGKVVRVRFWLSGQENAISPEAAHPYSSDLRLHLEAKGSGLRSVPSPTEDLSFLVVEDFETRGLRGSPLQEKDEAGVKNDFYYFWRNVGRSGKEDKDRGRWGLGKNVFPASSRINTFFGLTISADNPEPLLMGQSVLKVHEIGGERRYPYGYFGEIQKDGFALPMKDATSLDQFTSDFCIARKGELGLSLVIPFPDADITQDKIARSVIRQYFFPILAGTLVVMVGANGSETLFDSSTLLPHVKRMDEDFRREMEPSLELGQWARDAGEFISVAETPQEVAPQWTQESLPVEVISTLRPRFEKGERLAFRVPVLVRPKEGANLPSHFKVFLQRDLAMDSHRALFIREGLIVTDAVKTKLSSVYALVVVDDKPLATMLGDAENPAHTEWQPRSTHFRGRYHHGERTLAYIKNSVAQLVQLLTTSKEESDPAALQDVFFLPKPPEPEEARKDIVKKPKTGEDPPLPPSPPDSPETKVRVTKVKGGFSVYGAGEGAVPDRVRLAVAYEIRRGNPFKRYQPADFEFGREPVQIVADGATILEASRNRLLLGDLKANFKVAVTGFDSARDLVVRAVAEEPKPEEIVDAAAI